MYDTVIQHKNLNCNTEYKLMVNNFILNNNNDNLTNYYRYNFFDWVYDWS